MSGFAANWDSNKKNGGLGDRLRNGVNNPGAFKPRIEDAKRQIQSVIARLDQTVSRLRSQDASLFSRIVSSLQKRDALRATMYANELAEVRKMNKLVTQSRLALEQISLRFSTITDLGDVVMTLAPATSVITGVKQALSGVFPEADNQMDEISGLLSGILVDAGTVSGYPLNFEAANEEAEQTLAEAAAIAEERMNERFPEIPVVTSSEDSSMETA